MYSSYEAWKHYYARQMYGDFFCPSCHEYKAEGCPGCHDVCRQVCEDCCENEDCTHRRCIKCRESYNCNDGCEICKGNVCTECCEGHSDAEKFKCFQCTHVGNPCKGCMNGDTFTNQTLCARCCTDGSHFSCQKCDEVDPEEACESCLYQHGLNLCKECCDAHYKCPDCDKMFDYVCDCTKCNGCCECDSWVPELDKKAKSKKSKKRVAKRTETKYSKKAKQKRSRKR